MRTFSLASFHASEAVLLVLLTLATCGWGQTFVDAGTVVAPSSGASVAWGDFDSDGDHDLLATGYHSRPFTDIFRNDGGGVFTNLFPGPFATFTGVCFGDAAWADFDNDGHLEFIVTGATAVFGTGPALFKTLVYRSNRDGTFAVVANLPGIINGAIAVADYDNDGRVDVLLTGWNEVRRTTILYRNNGDGTFSDSFLSLPQLGDSSAAWGDFDRDGDLDLVLAGTREAGGGSEPSTRLFRNSGGGQLFEVAASLPGVADGTVAWGDFDSDGWLDLLLGGKSSGLSNIAEIFINGRDGNLSPIASTLQGFWQGDARWGDFDGDCDLDLLTTGSGPTNTGFETSIYRNSGADFGLLTNLASARFGTLAWGDWDRDGDIDIITANDSRLIRNTLSGSPARPTPPQYLSVCVSESNSVQLTWSNVNSRSAFGYNLRVGTAPGAGNIVSPMADSATGVRRLANFGNGPVAGVWKLNNLEAGTYYWSVQTVDGAFAGSSFAPESTFTVTNNKPSLSTFTNLLVAPNDPVLLRATVQDLETPASELLLSGWSSNTNLVSDIRFTREGTNCVVALVLATNQFGSAIIRLTVADAHGASTMREFNVTVQDYSPVLPELASADSHWADFNGDGRLDLLRQGKTVYLNRGAQFFPSWSTSLPEHELDRAVVADVDRDGDVDFFQLPSDWPRRPNLFLNRGDGRFLLGTNFSAVIPPLRNASAAWGDYDNDGDMDVVIMGNTNEVSNPPVAYTRLFQMSSNLTLTTSPITLRQLWDGTASWADFDNDGDLDLALCGRSRTTSPVTLLYRNDHGTNFSELLSAFLPVSVGLVTWAPSLAWGDMDNDRDLDLLVAGTRADGTNSARVYRNDGGGVFVDAQAGLADQEGSSASWGDFNNDGLLDILRGPSRGVRVYLNQGDGKFLWISTGILGATDGISAWGDMDNNGTLDLVNGVVDYYVTVYHNNSSRTNRPPSPPPRLRSAIDSSGTVLLEWDLALDPEQGGSLSYNVRIGTSPGTANVVPPGSHLQTGRPLLPAIGGCGPRTNFVVKGLPPGRYYWSVQAVDHGFAGSPFASEATFLFASRILHAGFTNEQFTVQYAGITGSNYVLDASNDLVSWSSIATNSALNGGGTLIDTRRSADTTTFYRMRALP